MPAWASVSNAAFERMSTLFRGGPTGGVDDEGPVEVAAAAVESGTVLRDVSFGGSVIDDPVVTDFPVVPSDQFGVPCRPGGGNGEGGGGGFCPF